MNPVYHPPQQSGPALIWIILGVVVVLAVLLLAFFALMAARRAAQAAEPLGYGVAALERAVADIGAAQNRVAGGLSQTVETQARMMEMVENRLDEVTARVAGGLSQSADSQSAARAQMLSLFETRMTEVSSQMGQTLMGSAQTTARSLGELQQRLEAIDKAQANIQKLSGDVLGLQDILSNKQARGAFGEIQLQDIVAKALPPDIYSFQATLSNGKRADCLVMAPNPPGPLAIDAKFPLEDYARMATATAERDKLEAARGFRSAVVKHLRDIHERYIIEGETADSAIMFLPSEAIYAEIHARFPDIVRQSFDLRVWIVSPTTLMATLGTLRAILRDVRMREHATEIRKELALLIKDLDRLGGRVEALEGHFASAEKDIREITISAQKSARRARRLEAFEFDDAGDAS